ncbi:nucleoside 2-deoxyribosyltransferase [Candidatus Sumerlaeota bacterium]|nr:nucleoside 2-deoxyribosyltransferase [Candidatus Sumerlaeota bacterium]
MNNKTYTNCLLCGHRLDGAAESIENHNLPLTSEWRGMYIFNCRVCTTYALSENDIHSEILNRYTQPQKSLLSHILCKRSKSGALDKKGFYVTESYINSILKNEKLPNPGEQYEILIHWLGDSDKPFGEYSEARHANIKAIIGAQSDENIKIILNALLRDKLIESENIDEYNGIGGESTNINPELATYGSLYHLRLSLEGWKKYQELKKGRTESKRVFMAMPFKNENDSVGDPYGIRQTYERLKDYVKQTGFELINPLLDEEKAGQIIERLQVEIRNSKFMIADLTESNNGAYWEAGYAKGLGKEVIYICSEEWLNEVDEDGKPKHKIHFDTLQSLTIRWNKDDLHAVGERLKAVIRNTFPSEAIQEDPKDV